MADITRVAGLRHLRGSPTAHIRHLRHGRVVHEGISLSFWFRPLNAVLSEIPVDDRELPLLFHARTADFDGCDFRDEWRGAAGALGCTAFEM